PGQPDAAPLPLPLPRARLRGSGTQYPIVFPVFPGHLGTGTDRLTGKDLDPEPGPPAPPQRNRPQSELHFPSARFVGPHPHNEIRRDRVGSRLPPPFPDIAELKALPGKFTRGFQRHFRNGERSPVPAGGKSENERSSRTRCL